MRFVVLSLLLGCGGAAEPDASSPSERAAAPGGEAQRAEPYGPRVSPEEGIWERTRGPTLHQIYPWPHEAEGLAHAREHADAARAQEFAEEQACSVIPREERTACPLLPGPARVEELPDGVRLRFDGAPPLEGLLARIRCHIAMAARRGPEAVATCPLYPPGVTAHASSDGAAIELRGRDPSSVREVKRRAAALGQPGD